jgi:hypothetical protein
MSMPDYIVKHSQFHSNIKIAKKVILKMSLQKVTFFLIFYFKFRKINAFLFSSDAIYCQNKQTQR